MRKLVAVFGVTLLSLLTISGVNAKKLDPSITVPVVVPVHSVAAFSASGLKPGSYRFHVCDALEYNSGCAIYSSVFTTTDGSVAWSVTLNNVGSAWASVERAELQGNHVVEVVRSEIFSVQ